MKKIIVFLILLFVTGFAIFSIFKKDKFRLYVDESDQAILISEMDHDPSLSGFGTRVIGRVYDYRMQPADGVITFHTSSGEASIDLIDGNFDDRIGEMIITRIVFSSPSHNFTSKTRINAANGAKIVIFLNAVGIDQKDM